MLPVVLGSHYLVEVTEMRLQGGLPVIGICDRSPCMRTM